MSRHLLAALAASVLTTLALAAPALAAPANDNFADARVLEPLPFTEELDLNGAGTEAGEPQFCNFQSQTVWYAITPSTTQALRLDLNGSDFGVVFNVYRAFSPGVGGLGFMGCIGFGGSFDLTAEPGATYYVQAGSVSVGPARMRLNVVSRPPPANDAFADARDVGSLPYVDSGDATLATTEAGEPTFPDGAFTPITGSVWYRFAPAADTVYTFNVNAAFSPILAVYTGSLGTLTQVPATSQFGRLTFRAAAGTTYMFQLGHGALFGGSGTYTLRVEVTPAPSVAFFWSPPDPSTFDDVQFSEHVFDVVFGTVASRRWDFGDGSASDASSPRHRYAADGDYTVTFEVTMTDGRTASSTQSIAVRTHDVAITKLLAPQSARPGQMRDVVATLANHRYAERVTVTLWKTDTGNPSGSVEVASATVDVPVLSSGRTTSIALPYMFTAQDATIGKVSFKVTAVLLGARDALPADNTALALPTKVKP